MEEMPPDDPQSRLAPKQYADILAFLLSANKIPPGNGPLVSSSHTIAPP
jgi:hypothetical protein